MNIPDPQTLEGEELNYWAGIAANKEVFLPTQENPIFGYDSRGEVIAKHFGRCIYKDKYGQWRHFDPIQDANQAIELVTEPMSLYWDIDHYDCCVGIGDVMEGSTIQEAICRAVVAKWIQEQKANGQELKSI